MAENDQKDKTVEKVTGEVENTDKKENNEDRYEKVCFICHRPESVTGKMIDLPNNICVCPDCMQKSFDAMNNINFGGMDYSQFMNMGPMMGFGDMDAQIPKSQRVKKKKPEEEKEPILNIKDIPAPHKIKAKLDEYVVGLCVEIGAVFRNGLLGVVNLVINRNRFCVDIFQSNFTCIVKGHFPVAVKGPFGIDTNRRRGELGKGLIVRAGKKVAQGRFHRRRGAAVPIHS